VAKDGFISVFSQVVRASVVDPLQDRISDPASTVCFLWPPPRQAVEDSPSGPMFVRSFFIP
jgi:hypothetical protein